jgi:hypothetical protein
MFAVWFILLLAFLGFGTLAAVVIGVVYAIANKRPGVAIASLLVPVALAVGVAMLLFLGSRSTRSEIVQSSTWHNGIQTWPDSSDTRQINISMPPAPPVPAIPAMPQIDFHASTAPAWLKLALVILVITIVARLIRRGSNCNSGRRKGLSVPVVAALMLVVLLNTVTFRSSRHTQAGQTRSSDIREVQEQAAAAQALEMKQEISQHVEQMSMQEMWDKVTKPRIKLAARELEDSMKVDGGAQPIAAEAPLADAASEESPTPAATPEALARSLERLERMVAQVSAMADKVSDTGTMIGKAMITLSDSIDSRADAKGGLSAAVAVRDVATKVVADHTPAATSTVQAEVEIPRQQTIEIAFDEQQLNQFGLSFEKIKGVLSRDGFWRGTTVRFVPNERRIVVSGNFDDDFTTRLKRTLIGTVGRTSTPLHLSDVATVSSDQGVEIAEQDTRTRPAWTDEPPKRIGNVWREVVATDEYATSDECARAADVYLLLKTYEHFQQLWGMPHGDNTLPSLTFHGNAITTTDGRTIYTQSGNSGIWSDDRILTLQKMGVGIDFIRREVVPANREYYETVERSFGPMKKVYTMLEFTPSVDAELRRRWDELRREDRFAVVGAGAGSVLGLIGLVFGMLKVDTWTKGYYTKRLFLGVPAAIIGGLALLRFAVG